MSAAPGAALFGPALLFSFLPPHILDTGVLQTAAHRRRQLLFLLQSAKTNSSPVFHESTYHYLLPGRYMNYKVDVKTVELRKKDAHGVHVHLWTL